MRMGISQTYRLPLNILTLSNTRPPLQSLERRFSKKLRISSQNLPKGEALHSSCAIYFPKASQFSLRLSPVPQVYPL